MKTTSVIKFATALLLLASLARAAAQGVIVTNLGSSGQDGVTYQGQLSTPAGPAANGSYDFVFTLFTTNSGGSAVAGPITNNAVAVNSNGLFTTLINIPYGDAYLASRQSNYLYLEIAVATNGNGSFTTLTPRQLLTPSLQSMYAVSAGTANGVSAAAVVQGQSLSVGQSNTLGGAYSTIAGGGNNAATMDYAVVAGGFGNTASSNSDTVAGGSINTASGPNATVGGGTGNTATGQNSVVAGGSFNSATGTNATVAGGDNNTALDYDFVGGGQSNVITAAFSVVCGGVFNHAGEIASAIVGGGLNVIQSAAFCSFIGGGEQNLIQSGAFWSVISGGDRNTIETSASESTISGGTANTIQPNASDSVISGGTSNTIQTYALASTIGGGFDNLIGGGLIFNYTNGTVIGTNTTFATVSGGSSNQATNSYTTIPGGQDAVAGNYAQLAYSSGKFVNPGDSQYSLYVLRNFTFGTNLTDLYLDGSSLEIALPANRSMAFNLNVVTRSFGGLTTVFLIQAGASGTTFNVGAPITSMPLNELALTPANVTLSVAGGFLHVQVFGGATTNPLFWTATVQATEMAH